MRFQQLGPNGITDIDVDGDMVLCAHQAASIQLTADPTSGSTNGLCLVLRGHPISDPDAAGSSFALLDVATAAQIVLGIEAAMVDAPPSMRQAFLDQLTLRGGH